MKKIIKAEWIRRILEQDGKPAVERVPCEFLLNTMYMEATGNQLRYPNSYRVRDAQGNIPDYIPVGTMDRINRDVMAWAGLKDQDPKLPSYPEIGGIILSKPYMLLSAIQQIGMVGFVQEKRTGIAKVETKNLKRKIFLREVAQLIERDL